MPYRTLARRSIGATRSLRIDVHLDDECYSVSEDDVANWIRRKLEEKEWPCSVSIESLNKESQEFSAKLVAELLGLPPDDVIDIMDNSTIDKWEALAQAYFGGSIVNKHRQLMYMFGVLLRGSQ